MNTAALTLGRVSHGSNDLLGRIVEVFDLLRAASRVAASVESHRAPSPADLEILGINDVPGIQAIATRR